MLKAFQRWGAKTSQTAIVLSILGAPAAALAQERAPSGNGDGMDTHLFRPAVDSKGFFSVNGSDILGAKNISFGLVLDYGRNLMRTRSHRVPNGTNDPATPYSWAVSLATYLDASLLTYEGEGHTAYGRSNQCIIDAVDDYLVDGVLPPDGLKC